MSVTVAATGDSLFVADFPPEYEKIRGSLDGFLAGCDLKLTNLETNLSDFGSFANAYSGGTWLNTEKELFPYLESFGFDFYGTANNHCMDYSYAGLLSTVDFLEKRGVAHAGTGRSLAEAEAPAVIKLKDGRTAAVFAVDASAESPSAAGEGSRVFAARPGVNRLRHETVYRVSGEDLACLRRIAAASGVNARREGEIAAGFMLPDRDGTFVFGETAFTSDSDIPLSRSDERDLSRLTGLFRRAKEKNALVFLLVHCHDEEGYSPADPPEYLKEFCRAAVDSGCDAVFGGGEHSLRGMEIYRGKPIFYSLGDFIYQGMRVPYLPPDFMRKYGVDPDAPAEEGLRARSKGGKIGLQTNEKNYLTVLPRITYGDRGEVEDITLMPVKLGFGTGNEKLDGLPVFAEGGEGEKIFRSFRDLSAPFGTLLRLEDGLVKVSL
jgi:poly-gamma-glutamate synthesis protein (capsule biosynthesis protein)